MPLRFFQCLNRQRTAQSRKRPRTAKGELRPSWLYPLRHEGEMRGLAVIFRCINYMGNSLGKVKTRTTEGMGNVGGSALITRSSALAIA